MKCFLATRVQSHVYNLAFILTLLGGGGPPFGGRPFANPNDRFRLGGPRDQHSPGGPPQRPHPPMQMHEQPPDANDCEIVVTSKHLTCVQANRLSNESHLLT